MADVEMNAPARKSRSRLSARVQRLRSIDELLLTVAATLLLAVPVYFGSPPNAREFNLFYMLPIVIPFGMFLFDRHRSVAALSPGTIMVDASVVGISIARIFISLPYVSGHALFLSYATLTTSRPWTRIVAAIGLWYTAYDKLSNFGNLWELLGGVILGAVCGLAHRKLSEVSAAARRSL